MNNQIPKHQCRNLHNKLEFERGEMKRLGLDREDAVLFIGSYRGGELMSDRFCSTCRIGQFYRRYPNYKG